MTTKNQLESEIRRLTIINNQLTIQALEAKTHASALQAALDSKFEDLEDYPDVDYGMATYHRNEKRRNVVRAAFQQIIEWAGRNEGYSEAQDEYYNVWEREATGLAGLVYLDHVEVYWAVRFAAEVCEQWNWHQEAARLMALYERMIAPPERRETDQQTVSWWAD
jgi:hypothetical protein